MKINNLFKLLAGTFLAATVFFSCEEKTGIEPDTLTVNPVEDLTFAATDNESVVLTVETNIADWTFTAPDWVEAVKGDNTLSVNAKDNTGAFRVGRIEFTAGNAKKVRIAVTQEGNENGSQTEGITARIVDTEGNNDIKVALDKAQNSFSATVKIVLDEPAPSDFNVQIILDPEYLATYSYENGVECENMPENTVTLPEEGIIRIASGSTESEPFELTADVSSLATGTNYLLPLLVQETEGLDFGIDSKRVNWLLRKKLTKEVKNLVYLEVNRTNPLNLLEYNLEDGTPFFDVAVIFAANIVYDSAKDKVVLQYNPNVQKLLDENVTYLQPLRKAGIEVQLGLLPDHTHAGLQNLSDKGIKQFAAQVADALAKYDLDGINMDEEYVEADPTNQSDLFIRDGEEPTGLKLCYEIKRQTEAKGRKCGISVFNFKWESNKAIEVDGQIHQTGEIVDILMENYLYLGEPMKAEPWDASMTRKQCSGTSIECNKGYKYDYNSKWNTDITINEAKAVKDEGYGWIMWYAFHPQIGGGLDNNASVSDPAIRNVAQGLYGQSIMEPKYYYRKIDEGIYSPDPVERTF